MEVQNLNYTKESSLGACPLPKAPHLSVLSTLMVEAVNGRESKVVSFG